MFREILIASDSHGKTSHLRALLSSHPRADMLLFCGDGVRDVFQVADEFPNVAVIAVRGNCDFFGAEDVPYEKCFTVNGIRILMMHGHLHGVKGGIGAALSYAGKQNADILLFGHTHIRREERAPYGEKNIMLFNPGSIGKRDDGVFSYGVLTVQNESFLLSHGNLEELD